MIIVSRDRLQTFIREHKRGKEASRHLLAWFDDCSHQRWLSPHQLKQHYPKASIMKGGVVIFNILGNEFRLITKVNYQAGVILVEWVGTHQDYDKISAETVQWKEQ